MKGHFGGLSVVSVWVGSGLWLVESSSRICLRKGIAKVPYLLAGFRLNMFSGQSSKFLDWTLRFGSGKHSVQLSGRWSLRARR